MNWYDPLLVFPSFLYRKITDFRNHLFDIGYKKSISFDIPVISVGNLTVGGTGKTPMVELLIRVFAKDRKLATLSRGYGRKSYGYILANDDATAVDIGDEPMQLYTKFGHEVAVCVGEERALAIPHLLQDRPDTQIILLDDAYQHRYVKADVQILLSSYYKPFYNDKVLPLGRLREHASGAKRADILVITKCPKDISEEEKETIEKECRPFLHKQTPILFASEKYEAPHCVFESELGCKFKKVVLLTAIANASSLKSYLTQTIELVYHFEYPDHHLFTKADLLKIKKYMNDHPDCCLLTTEKDMVKLNANQDFDILHGCKLGSIGMQTDMDEKLLKKIIEERLNHEEN